MCEDEMSQKFPPGRAPANNVVSVISLFNRFQQDFIGEMNQLFDTYGDIVSMEMMGRRTYLLRHPDHLHRVLVEDAASYYKNADYTDERRGLARFLGNGLLTSDGEFWKRQRKLVSPALHMKRIAGYAETMVEETRKMLDRWDDGALIDIDHEMMRTTLGIVTRSLFQADIDTEADRVGSAVTVLQEFASSSNTIETFLPDWVPTPRRTREQNAVRDLDRVVYGVIENWRRQSEDHGDLLSMLMLARDDDGQPMSDRQVRDEIVTIFLAGHETTANTLNFALYLLSRRPEAAARLREEIDEVLHGTPPTLDDLKHLPYTERVIKEAMRLYPPAFTVSRVAIRDTTIGEYDVPADTDVVISIYGAHHDPRWWSNPEAFDPDRFLPELEDARPRYAFLPFGAGPRVCVGFGFAQMEAQIMLAMIAQRFAFDAPAHNLEKDARLTLRPKGGLRLRAHARQRTPDALPAGMPTF
ncbi:cytochrome P450 [Anaerolineae bacterium CFX9]|nr:cytochrome P450 [Anaerolineae bacterium CFX9]